MVNQTVSEYLKQNKGKYDLNKLKNKVLIAGYSQTDIDEALAQLTEENIDSTLPITKPLIPLNRPQFSVPVSQSAVLSSDSSSKSIKWLVITLIIAILILIGVGVASWYFLLR